MNHRQISNLLALTVTLAVNGLANALPLNGKTTGGISDTFPTLFTPAGYVFAIWGVIYVLLIAFAIYQALPAQRNNPRLERLGYWFVASCAFNSIWIFLWHYELFPLTLLAMIGVLVSLLMSYLRLGIGASQVSSLEKILVNLPFSVYFGWISVATVANASVFLYDLGWNGGSIGPTPWTVVMILIAFALGAAMIFLRHELAYALVLAWAFAGIAVKQSGVLAVAIVAAAAAVGLLGLLIIDRIRRWTSPTLATR